MDYLGDQSLLQCRTAKFNNISFANPASQKYLAARSVSRTAPEVVLTATILIRFCVATDAIDAAWAGAGLVFDFLRFAVFGLVFAPIAFPGDGGSGRLAA
jgi:nucleoside permease NupC